MIYNASVSFEKGLKGKNEYPNKEKNTRKPDRKPTSGLYAKKITKQQKFMKIKSRTFLKVPEYIKSFIFTYAKSEELSANFSVRHQNLMPCRLVIMIVK